MRPFTETEIENYNKVRDRHPDLNLPEFDGSNDFNIETTSDELLTLVKINTPTGTRLGRAVFSREDRKRDIPFNFDIGINVAFHDALYTPIPEFN